MNEAYAQYIGRTYGTAAEQTYRKLAYPWPDKKIRPEHSGLERICEECKGKYFQKRKCQVTRFCSKRCANLSRQRKARAKKEVIS